MESVDVDGAKNPLERELGIAGLSSSDCWHICTELL